MASNITVGIKDLIAEAKAEIEEWSVEQILAVYGGEGIVIIDVRDVRERQRDGFIPGSVHVPRGMIEFWIDPDSPYHKTLFTQDKRFIFHCASGWRSALAAHSAQKMGLAPVCHMGGGFAAWKESGGLVELSS